MTLDPDSLREFNRFRGTADGTTVCPAPLINLHFSQLGIVTACCFNRTHVLGVYPTSSIEEIWNGPAAGELREALAKGDLSKGCEKCWQQIQARDFAGSHALFYTERAEVMADRRVQLGMAPEQGSASMTWPMKLEFNIHNACNLQCIMCHGLASSAIRTHREGLGALPNPYDDAFVDQLEPYLPHVVEADFLGGEPFLINVYRRIWQMIARVNPKTQVCILTNATTLDDGIKSILEGLNCWIHVSIDSFHKQTYEMIRRGASYDVVMANLRYFQDLMKARGRPMAWRYCPMRVNWHEIPDTVTYCSEREIILSFNQLDSPIGLALTTLPVAELAKVVDTLRANEPRLPATPISIENLQNYRELVDRLSGFIRPSVRRSALLTRLNTAHAVVSQYSLGREQVLRKRPAAGVKDALVQAVKTYLITRLNVDQATTAEHLDFRERLTEAERTLVDLHGRVSFSEFLATYLEELIRTYSGVWGVIEAHDQDVFARVAEFVAELRTEGPPEDVTAWIRVIRSLPRTAYESLSTASSTAELREWLDAL
jgi:MoaA/NifB/PqqE/SkfB family radical SAM enzyme